MDTQPGLPEYSYAGARAMVILHECQLRSFLATWKRAPLASVPENRFEHPEFESRWKTKYCVDAMLEHAVMHLIRHEFQLSTLLAAAGAR